MHMYVPIKYIFMGEKIDNLMKPTYLYPFKNYMLFLSKPVQGFQYFSSLPVLHYLQAVFFYFSY